MLYFHFQFLLEDTHVKFPDLISLANQNLAHFLGQRGPFGNFLHFVLEEPADLLFFQIVLLIESLFKTQRIIGFLLCTGRT